MSSLAYIDGEVKPLHEAKVSLEDNGYLLGDGVFETMRTTRSGKLFRPDLHVARAAAGLGTLLLPADNIWEQFMSVATELTEAAVKEIGAELYIRINISSGTSRQWADTPTLKITGIAKQLHSEKPGALSCITWNHHGQLHELSDVKSLSYARSALLRRKVARENVDDIILISPDDTVVESSVSNVIARKGSTVFAPGTASGALPGTTQHIIVCELLPKDTYVVQEQLTVEELYECDEVMLTSSLSGVRRVAKIDNREFSEVTLFDQLHKKYNDLLD